MMEPYRIDQAGKEDLETLDAALTDYNIQVAKELPRAEITRLDFTIKDENGLLLGGIQAYRVNWGILHIELLYVDGSHRGRGIASSLLAHVEKIAKDHQCYLAHLSTFDFQAKDFYIKQGYVVFGILENAPKGHCRYYTQGDPKFGC